MKSKLNFLSVILFFALLSLTQCQKSETHSWDSPKADFKIINDPDSGGVVHFINQSSRADHFDWTIDGSTYTDASPTKTFNSSGTYYAYLTATAKNGSTDQASQSFTVSNTAQGSIYLNMQGNNSFSFSSDATASYSGGKLVITGTSYSGSTITISVPSPVLNTTYNINSGSSADIAYYNTTYTYTFHANSSLGGYGSITINSISSNKVTGSLSGKVFQYPGGDNTGWYIINSGTFTAKIY